MTAKPTISLADQLLIDRIGTPANDSVQDAIRFGLSAGSEDGGYITDAGGATIDVAAGAGFIRTSDAPDGDLKSFEWAASSGIAIPANVDRYVGVEYNAGSPQIVIKTSNSWDGHTEFRLGSVVNESGTLHITNNPQQTSDGVQASYHRLFETEPLKRADRLGGLILGETGTRNPTLSAGELYDGFNEFIIAAIDCSAADTFDAYYLDGIGGWTKQSGQTQWNNTQYDDGDGTLGTLTNNRWGTHWLYVELDGSLVLVYGSSDSVSQAGAESEGAPSTIPLRLQVHGKLIGRLVFKKSAATATVESVFSTNFGPAQVTSHTQLSDIGTNTHAQIDTFIANAGIQETQIVYFGLHGSASPSGLGRTIGSAYNSPTNALARASALTPSASNQIAVVCLDSGIYVDAPTVPSFVRLFAPNAVISSPAGTTVTLTDNSSCVIGEISTAGTGLYKQGLSSGSSHARVRKITCSGSANAVLAVGTRLNERSLILDIDEIEVSGGNALYGLLSGDIKGRIGKIRITGAGSAVYLASDSNYSGLIGEIVDASAGTGIRIATNGGTFAAQVGKISCATAYNIASGGVLKLDCTDINGARTTSITAAIQVGARTQHVVYSNIYTTGTGLITVRSANFSTAPTTYNHYPRTLQVTTTGGWNGGDVLATGLSRKGDTIAEVIPTVGAGTTKGTQVFAYVATVQNLGSRTAGTCQPQMGEEIGLPDSETELIVMQVNGNPVVGIWTSDIIRGTIIISIFPPNNVNDYEFLYRRV